MGSVGDAYDNALCESFFATLECELLDRRRFRSQAEARIAVFTFIEGWYNPPAAFRPRLSVARRLRKEQRRRGLRTQTRKPSTEARQLQSLALGISRLRGLELRGIDGHDPTRDHTIRQRR
jgi:hypothetical protein